MLGTDDAMDRVSRRNPCPICGKADWCLVASDESAAICARIDQGSVKRCGEAGFLHILRDDPNWRLRPKVRTIHLHCPDLSYKAWGQFASGYRAATDMNELLAFADYLGLAIENLIRLRIGWSQQDRAWTFPMHDADARIRGIRLRNWAGRKWAICGSKDGLFIPIGLSFTGTLFICEGPTDTAALLDVGLEVVGRASCTSGRKLLIDLIRYRRPISIAIVGDRDANGAGQRGAETLASDLLLYTPSISVIYPPEGIKDARAWVQAGATQQDVQTEIDAAKVRKISMSRRAGK